MTQFGVTIAAEGAVGQGQADAPESQFGFRVNMGERQEWDWREGKYQPIANTETWVVSLPHQCDRWEITYAPLDQAVTELEAFIAEARAALEILRNQQRSRDFADGQ